jgi:GNAT superfamily N-acetyltransferase
LPGFFVGWPNPPSPDRHLQILHGSTHVWLAHTGPAENPKRVVGFINAIGDGQLSAFIPLLEVLPDYQSQGIGGELVARMLATLQHYYAVDLICDADLQPFYARFGGTPWNGMIWRNRAQLGPTPDQSARGD